LKPRFGLDLKAGPDVGRKQTDRRQLAPVLHLAMAGSRRTEAEAAPLAMND